MPLSYPQIAVIYDHSQKELGFTRLSEAMVSAKSPDDPEPTAELIELSEATKTGLETLFSFSPYLTECALAEPEFALAVFDHGPDHAFHRVLTGLREARKEDLDQSTVMRLVREAKRRGAFAIAVGDLMGHWSLDQVTGAISALARETLQSVVDHLLLGLHKKGSLVLPDPAQPSEGSGFTVLAMGKLGAGELNYSSDIDVIVLFDAEKPECSDQDKLRQDFIRITKTMIKMMQERTADGYVFRTDLRLRPDPNVTAVAVSVQAAEAYYESVGLTWERAAMIKAKPIAGDITCGDQFLLHIRPFIWRKFLDFAAIEDVHAIKRRINAHRGHSAITVLGHDVKVGRGGIREIEFFAQTQQLIWGGRNWTLRTNRTLDALSRLATEGLITVEAEADMHAAYEFLRAVEHRLQMINDAQTQAMPDTTEGLDRLARMMGYAKTDDFEADITAHLKAVEHHYVHLFEDSDHGIETAPDPIKDLSLAAGDTPGLEELAAIEALGFKDAAMVHRTVATWSQGGCRATRNERARTLLNDVMPNLLEAFGGTTNPDQAFVKFDGFLKGLPAGVQLFSLFRSHPGLLSLVADIMGSAPRLADTLAKQPNLLDSVLDADFFESIPAKSDMLADLNKNLDLARSYEEMLDYVRRWRHDRLFQVGVLILRQVVSPAVSTQALTDMADACLQALLPRVETEFAEKHGRVPWARFAIVGMGKLGSAEMSPASDLDLVMVYDLPSEDAASDGPKPLSGNQYFSRLTQRMINAVSAPTAEGQLYEVDMRLRPSGNAGPIAAKLATLSQYYCKEAWDWEFLALTRARGVAGDSSLLADIDAVFNEALRAQRNQDRLLTNVCLMRRRMAAEHGTNSPWRIKHVPGGLVDIEFLTQYLQLRHAHDNPEILVLGTRNALDTLRDAGLLAKEDWHPLVEAHELWLALQSMLRLTVEDRSKLTDSDTFPTGLKVVLSRLCSSVDFATLETKIKVRSRAVHEIYQKLVDNPAEALLGDKADQAKLNQSSLIGRMTETP